MLRHYDGQRALAHLYLSAPLRPTTTSIAVATVLHLRLPSILLSSSLPPSPSRPILVPFSSRSRPILVYPVFRFSALGSYARAYACACRACTPSCFAYLHVHARFCLPDSAGVSVYRQQRRSPRDREAEGRAQNRAKGEPEKERKPKRRE